MEFQHPSHNHPLVFEEERSHESDEKAYCYVCGEVVSGPTYSCVACGFHLDKNCAEAPLQMNHPFHRNHSLTLGSETPVKFWFNCDFCNKSLIVIVSLARYAKKPKPGDLFTVVQCARLPFTSICVLKGKLFYHEIASKDAFEKLIENPTLVDPTFLVIKEIKLGENVINREIKHFSHEHNLVLYDEVRDDKCCDCCSLLIETSFYHCSKCDFYLHKSCAELPMKSRGYFAHLSLNLIPNHFFKCRGCKSLHTGFAYNWKGFCLCVQCAEFSLSYASQAHKEHLLLYYKKYNGQCNACGNSIDNAAAYRCKSCNFNVHWACTLLPQTARHKCDDHSLKLTYYEVNDYSEYHSCDICEERKIPNIWFYHCALCDKSAHPKCVLGDYPFIKLGRRISAKTDHPHSLILVQKVYLYPDGTECSKCGQLCLDLALECTDTRCSFIIHWRCSSLKDFIEDHNIVELIAKDFIEDHNIVELIAIKCY
ncbi:Cysteine/Histidine-rich C1 domain family protein, putative [Theobroma cacao]|uniref:Cysteine/Histidine-rich C1 domain family protein, putative n=1 Tax=Theobroma cacao TaxID=3641 RepID=A0A061FNN7_THECC|nr:Cysteine/Histidine-rich C1 domain family protein, putative [Theobroma cacao]